MNKKNLVYSLDENTFIKEISILQKPSEIRILSNPIAWKIVNLLAGHPMYPAQIAKELKIKCILLHKEITDNQSNQPS